MPNEPRRSADLSIVELKRVLKALMKQVNATKTIYFRQRGVVKYIAVVPDHAAQLRALCEIVKLRGLYPKPGSRKSVYDSDGGSPILNVVIPDSDVR